MAQYNTIQILFVQSDIQNTVSTLFPFYFLRAGHQPQPRGSR